MNRYNKARFDKKSTNKALHFGIMKISIFVLVFQSSCTFSGSTLTLTPPVTLTIIPTSTPNLTLNTYYVDGSTGDDSGTGTESEPWKTIQKALNTATAGDTVYVRGGQYDGVKTGWVFQNSGTQSQPITLTNYPGEQVVFKMGAASDVDRYIFRCSINPHNPPSWQTTKADYIRIVGTDVPVRLLSNGVQSVKGIVMQGMEGEQSPAITASDCDYWEVAGVDFVETAYGIFTRKNNWHSSDEHSTDHWHVHDNRVYNYYRESGMQFNGNYNLIVNNEIYKVSNRLDSPFGCQLLNLLGNNNIVRGNTLSRLGSTVHCTGILFEWDLSDANLIENNTISDVLTGMGIYGGDGNVIKNNRITASPGTTRNGIVVASYDNRSTWPCDDYVGSGSSSETILPPNDPAHPDYPYYYNPRNCHSMNNQIIGNTILGFQNPWTMSPVADHTNIFIDNMTEQP